MYDEELNEGVCSECGEKCKFIEETFSYSGTNCTHGLPGVHHTGVWVSDCCGAAMQNQKKTSKVALRNIYTHNLGDVKELRLDWDNDRRHAILIDPPFRLENVIRAFEMAIFLIAKDHNLK